MLGTSEGLLVCKHDFLNIWILDKLVNFFEEKNGKKMIFFNKKMIFVALVEDIAQVEIN